MKVIDLLNKIAKGNIPKNIRYNDLFMTYNTEKQNYFDNFGSEIDWKYTVMNYINDEVEIIEEDKNIEKLYIRDRAFDILIGKNEKTRYATDSLVSKELALKINEIIDKLNEMSDKEC